MTDPITLIESRLSAAGKRPTRKGDGIEACCPAHDDHNPSLSVAPGTKGRDVVIHCHAGCDAGAVMAALDLKWTDLAEKRNGSSQIVATYDYTDADGQLLYQVVRMTPKTFRQRRPKGRSGWEWRLGDTQRTLYNLPAVVAQAAAGGEVWITEGEKDADALAKLGHVATCNSGGAGKFTLEMAEYLKGARVSIVADDDKAGHDHAAEVAFLATSCGAVSVRTLVPATGKDVSDHLAAGLGLDDLAPLELEPTEPDPEAHPLTGLAASVVDWGEFWATDHSATTWLMEPLFAAGRGHAVYAEAKAGKSWIVLAACCALATGRPFLNRPASEPIDVLYLDYEMTAADLQDRLEQFGYGPSDDLSRLHYALLPNIDDLDDPTGEGGSQVHDMAIACGAQLVVIDTTSRAVGGEENEAGTYRNLYKTTLGMLKAAGIAVVRLDHTGKDVTKGMRGSSAKAADVDVVVHLKQSDGGKEWKATHRRIGWYPESTNINITEDANTGVFSFGTDTEVWPEGTRQCAEHLDALGIPTDATRRVAQSALAEADLSPRKNNIVSAALRFRRSGLAHQDLEDLVP